MTSYSTGAVLSPPDQRDYTAAQFAPAAATALPAVWDFRSALQPVRNQGGEGTCVGHAAAAMMGYQQMTAAPPGKLPDREVLSPRALYEGGRMLEWVNGEGSTPRSVLKYAQQQGAPAERLWPYVPGVRGQPLAGAVESAFQNRILTYSRAGQLYATIREALYWHGPALIVVTVDGGFERTGADGVIRPGGMKKGRHAVLACGWDDRRGALLIRNSWGPEWGLAGDALLPEAWRIEEAWVSTPALNAPPPEVSWLERIAPWLFLG